MSDASPALSSDEGRALLDIARRAIMARASGGAAPDTRGCSGALLEHRGAFVTLRSGGGLRGCIGVVEAERPLAATVARFAAAAASEDPRFPPLAPGEAAACVIEISILDPPFEVRSASAITLGRHGLIVSRGRQRGLLLPQVAREQSWDVATFIRETCRKAGLEPTAWERGARLEVFSVQVFAETGATAPRPVPPAPPRSLNG